MNPLSTIDTAPWRTEAACATTDPELFFATDDASVREAKQQCAVCPVRVACLETAIALGEMHGIWGGMAEGERRRLIKHRRRERRERTRRSSAA